MLSSSALTAVESIDSLVDRHIHSNIGLGSCPVIDLKVCGNGTISCLDEKTYAAVQDYAYSLQLSRMRALNDKDFDREKYTECLSRNINNMNYAASWVVFASAVAGVTYACINLSDSVSMEGAVPMYALAAGGVMRLIENWYHPLGNLLNLGYRSKKNMLGSLIYEKQLKDECISRIDHSRN